MLRAGKLILAALLCLSLFSGCGGDKKDLLKRMFDPEERGKAGATPWTEEDLKKGIDQYYAVAVKTAEANAKVGTYWRILANVYLDKLMFGEAYDAALKALRYYPDNSSLYYITGMCAAYLARVASADINAGSASREAWLKTSEASYLTALKLNDTGTNSMYGLAVLYVFEFDRPDQAIPYLERFLAINTKNSNAMFLYARTLYSVERFQEAVDAYDRIIKADPSKEKRKQAEANKKQILDQMYGQ